MYDFERGEGRAKVGERKKVETGKATLADLGFSEDTTFGDCIDCYQCVRVCPMGIDIRNGTQLECVHCTACIDACDAVMDKIDKPRGLIRYSSYTAIKDKNHKLVNPRVLGYSTVLLILVTVFITLMTTRSSLETTILREPGTLYQELPNNRYSNIYELKVINKTFDPIDYSFELVSPPGEIIQLGSVGTVPGQSLETGRFMVQLDRDDLTGLQTQLTFDVFVDGEKVETVKTGFLGPSN